MLTADIRALVSNEVEAGFGFKNSVDFACCKLVLKIKERSGDLLVLR
jgi:hypothetical protein